MKPNYIDQPNETSFHGQTIKLSKNELQTFCACEPNACGDSNEKVQYEWIMETVNGKIFTIYDWKEYRAFSDDETIEWHIGANTSDIAVDALDEIVQSIEKLN